MGKGTLFTLSIYSHLHLKKILKNVDYFLNNSLQNKNQTNKWSSSINCIWHNILNHIVNIVTDSLHIHWCSQEITFGRGSCWEVLESIEQPNKDKEPVGQHSFE